MVTRHSRLLTHLKISGIRRHMSGWRDIFREKVERWWRGMSSRRCNNAVLWLQRSLMARYATQLWTGSAAIRGAGTQCSANSGRLSASGLTVIGHFG